MVKLIGAILVLVSAYAIGSLLALQVKEQEKWLKDMKTTLFLLLGELEYRQVPLPEALAIVGKRHGGRLAPGRPTQGCQCGMPFHADPRHRRCRS